MPIALPTLPQLERPYRCPGQRDGITETVHQARLRAGDPRCVDCPHNPDRTSETAAMPAGLVHDRGHLRGRHLRGLDAGRLAGWLTAWAASHAPRQVVVGQDDRHASADLASAWDALARQGLAVVDLGRTRRPLLDSAVAALGADAGLYLSGGSRGAGWSGLEIVERDGSTGTLDLGTATPSGRISRRGQRPIAVDAASVDQAAMRSLAGSLPRPPRPIAVRLSVADAAIAARLRRLLPLLPCRIVRTTDDERADLWVRMLADGQRLEAFDAEGRPLSPATIGRTIAPAWARLCDLPQAATVGASEADDPELETLLQAACRRDAAGCGVAWAGSTTLLWDGLRFRRDAALTLLLLAQALATP